MMRPKITESTEDAEVIALKALSFLATDPERLSRFMDLSGLGIGDIRASAEDPAFLGGVLDHLLANFMPQPATASSRERLYLQCGTELVEVHRNNSLICLLHLESKI